MNNPTNPEENNGQGAQQSVAYQELVSTGFDAQKQKQFLKFPVPLLIVAAYLFLGFLFDLWHPGWLLFFAIPIYYQLIAMAAARELRKKLNLFPMALLCVVVYLLLGFFLNLWHPGWMLFLLIPIYHTLVSTAFKKG